MNTILEEKWREILAKNILSERKRLDLSQVALANKLGAKEGSTVSFWENGKGEFNVATLMKLCAIFSRMPNDLLTTDLRDSPPSQPPERHNKEEADTVEGGHKQPAAAKREEPPPKAEKGELQAMRRQVLEVLNKIEEMESAQ